MAEKRLYEGTREYWVKLYTNDTAFLCKFFTWKCNIFTFFLLTTRNIKC